MTEGAADALLLSAWTGALAAAVALPPAALLGRWMAGARFRGKAAVETLLLLPLVLPPVVVGFGLLLLLGRRGPLGGALEAAGFPVVFTWRACVVAAAVSAFPLAYRTARAAFEGVDRRLVDQARTLGATPRDAFLSVEIPLARNGLLAAAVLAFARAVGEFGATVVLAGNVAGETRTLPLAVYSAIQGRGTDGVWPLALLSVLLAGGALAAGEFLLRRDAR